MKQLNFLFFGLLMFVLSACFEKDETIPLEEFNGQAFVFTQSIYTNQFFYDLSTNSIVSQNENNKWDISFDCKPGGWAVRINSSNFLGVWPTGITNFNVTSFPASGRNWKFDKSNGDADSTGIGKWVNISSFPYSYSNEVYIIGQYDGISYKSLKKLLFYNVSDSSYSIKYADINGENMHDTVVMKDTMYNQVYFSFVTNSLVKIEPPKNNWDLLFLQYETLLYTAEGVPAPYFVRGTLINPNRVMVALDSIHSFPEINRSLTENQQFKSDWDVIGHDWKSVQVNQQANTAIYSVRQNYSYIIKDTQGEYYKFKFISFFNSVNSPGYPSYIFLKL